MLRQIFLFMLTILLVGCNSIPTLQDRQRHADLLTASKGWIATRLAAGSFDLVAYIPKASHTDDLLTIYIEGDGFAWLSSSTPSADPTPRDPLALRLALAQPEGNAVYLARPCQYINVKKTGCSQRYWTYARFASEVIDSSNLAIDALKQRLGASRLVLVGYSGGGAVALLVAARRNDVVRLITVAGNLDQQAWTAYHQIESLSGSLNAVDVVNSLTALPQKHYVGGKDKVIPPALAQKWPIQFIGVHSTNLSIIPDFDHRCCWVEHWPRLFSTSFDPHIKKP